MVEQYKSLLIKPEGVEDAGKCFSSTLRTLKKLEQDEIQSPS
jgi:hypothetical protein